MPYLNHRQLTERSRRLGGDYRSFRAQLAWWRGAGKRFSKPYMRASQPYIRAKQKHYDTAQGRIIRLVTILQAQKRRQQTARAARNKKIAQEKLWLKKHGHMMFKSLGKRKR